MMNNNTKLLSVNTGLPYNTEDSIYNTPHFKDKNNNVVVINAKNSTKKIAINNKINNYINEQQIQNNNFSLSEIKTISSGRSARVYLVVDNKTNNQYAFKQFFSNKDFVCELRFFQHVDRHPNIVEYLGVDSLHGNYGLVLSYIDGCDLNYLTKYLCNKYIDNTLNHSDFWGIIQYIFYHILLGIQHIHEYNFAHQDLKPSNIIFDKNKLIPIIIDFNMSHACGEVLSPGKEEYAAPEFFTSNGTAKVSEITDSYSIGQLLYKICFSIISADTTNTFLAGAKTEDLTSKDRVIMLLRMRTAFREYIKLNDNGQYKTAIKALSHKEVIKLINSSADDNELRLSGNFKKNINHNGNKLVGYYNGGYESSVVNFINECMHPDPELRLTIDDALQHPFIIDRIININKAKYLLKSICYNMEK